jgi:hypothetical protein
MNANKGMNLPACVMTGKMHLHVNDCHIALVLCACGYCVFIPYPSQVKCICLCCRPPFEVMEVWLEGLAMHLSVEMPLPQDLEFDIYNYTGM